MKHSIKHLAVITAMLLSALIFTACPDPDFNITDNEQIEEPGKDDDDNKDDDKNKDDDDNNGGDNDANNLVATLSAEPHAFRAILNGQYSGNKMPEQVGFEYSYDSTFPAKKTASILTKGKIGGFELEAVGLVDQAKVYYRAIVIAGGQTIYGKVKSLVTTPGTYTIDGKTYNFIKVTGLSTGSFSMMQTELSPTAELTIDGIDVGILNLNSQDYVTKGETREFFNRFAQAAVVPRYPTAQEWLYASAGGSKSKEFKYSGSNNIDEVAWYADNSNGRARKPAQKVANELGFYDMSGNYAELCASYDDEDLEDIRELYICKFIRSLKELPARYFDVSWSADCGAFGGKWDSSASKCQKNYSEEYTTPRQTNHYDGSRYTIRLVYSRPD